jgi:large subunit ribosomal protein L21
MYAICKIAGHQYRVEPNLKIKVSRLSAAEGDTVEFPELLLVSDEESTQIGTPVVPGKVVATVLNHGRYPTITVFKRKRRKDYKVLKGHRQGYTEVLINSIER